MSALRLEKRQSFPPENILTIYRIFSRVRFVKPPSCFKKSGSSYPQPGRAKRTNPKIEQENHMNPEIEQQNRTNPKAF
jgi:hypothetical protein